MNFWDSKYKQEEFGYGVKPNIFLKEILSKKQAGSILLPAEGEGRNAIYASKLGWKVTAFDSSIVAREKALELAIKNNVQINYTLNTIEAFESDEQFDLIAVIYLHLFSEERKNFHKKLMNLLKPGGNLIFEVFAKDQLALNSGGPKNIDMLYTVNELKEDFYSYDTKLLEQKHIHLDEGKWHIGEAEVIRGIISKN